MQGLSGERFLKWFTRGKKASRKGAAADAAADGTGGADPKNAKRVGSSPEPANGRQASETGAAQGGAKE